MKRILDTKLKDINAITLIALVITIVVLIILATVIINLSLSDNGIFNRAREAKEQYQNAEDYEKEQIAKATNEINSYVDGNRGTVTLTEEQYQSILDRLTSIEQNTIDSANTYATKITTTSPAISGSWEKVANYPAGYTRNNTFITGWITGNANDNSDTNERIIPTVTSNNDIFSCVTLRDDGVYMWVRSALVSRPLKLLLIKAN